MAQLQVGIARANITPPVGMRMAGYAARKTPAVGVHDDLHAVALYLTDGAVEAALITLDLIGLGAVGVARARQACAQMTGLPEEHVMVAGSHTHSGPIVAFDDGDPLREAYGRVLVHKMAGAVAEAKRGAVPARMGHARQDCGFAMNRRERRPDGVVILGVNPDGPTTPYTDVIRLDRLEPEQPLAVLFSYACHGTNMGPDNLLYSAEFPGVAKQLIERELPPALAAFMAGCSGDINPYPRGTLAHADRHGRRLGCAAVQAALDIEAMETECRLAVAREEFALPLERTPSLDEARGMLAEVSARAEEQLAQARAAAGGKPVDERDALDWFTAGSLQGARELVAALEKGEADFAVRGEVQALAVGDCAIVGLPGEIFVNIGLAIAAGSPFPCTLAISHTNGSIGYVPTADQVPLGGYEVQQARARRYGIHIAPEADSLLIAAASRALRRCADTLAPR